MSRIKADLICEIIRMSQTNFLGKKRAECSSENFDQTVMDWIRKNAATYRKNFQERLDGYSNTELGEILKILTDSKKDLNEKLEGTCWAPPN